MTIHEMPRKQVSGAEGLATDGRQLWGWILLESGLCSPGGREKGHPLTRWNASCLWQCRQTPAWRHGLGRAEDGWAWSGRPCRECPGARMRYIRHLTLQTQASIQ